MDENPYQAPEEELAKTSEPIKRTRSAALGCGCLLVGGFAWTVICFVAAIILDEQYAMHYEANILATLSLIGFAAAIIGALGVLASFLR